MEPYWGEANGHAPHSVKYENETAVSSFPYCSESNLNFSTSATAFSEDDAEYSTGRRNKTSRQDPLSHRIIEKRRRDRMNSCLADLSRLIPPQYQRKGRGRIEKTEIIEMAIRHLKHLQNECIQKENDYRQGYSDCMKEAAKFLYNAHMQEFCYRLVARLQEHCDEVMKSECYKSRGCQVLDNVSASSGSPHHVYHSTAPICQLREMLGTTSDIEHSNDQSDVKDLSFRNHLNQLQRNNNANKTNTDHQNGLSTSTSSSSSALRSNNPSSTTPCNASTVLSTSPHPPHQAAVITSTAPASLHHHTDSSNHDFESSREPLLNTDTSNMHSPPLRESILHNSNHHMDQHNHHTNDTILSSGRLRIFSESSHDVEHNNNYKYKNHIKERFNHELHDEETSSEQCAASTIMQGHHSNAHSDYSNDGTEPEIAPIIAKKRKMAEAANSINDCCALDANDAMSSLLSSRTPISNVTPTCQAGRKDKAAVFAYNDIKTEINSSSPPDTAQLRKAHCNASSAAASILGANPPQQPPVAHTIRSFAVPIFALHAQGTYYVPLNVDYNALLPFLNGIDLVEKTYTPMPVVHPININVNFMPTMPPASLLTAAAATATATVIAAGKHQLSHVILNGNVSTTVANVATKAKQETTTNEW